MAITRCFLISQGILYFRVNNNSQTAYRVVTHKRYISSLSSSNGRKQGSYGELQHTCNLNDPTTSVLSLLVLIYSRLILCIAEIKHSRILEARSLMILSEKYSHSLWYEWYNYTSSLILQIHQLLLMHMGGEDLWRNQWRYAVSVLSLVVLIYSRLILCIAEIKHSRILEARSLMINALFLACTRRTMIVCCSSPYDPCFLPLEEERLLDDIWRCPTHHMKMGEGVLLSWSAEKVSLYVW
jgi:hypothetical protein